MQPPRNQLVHTRNSHLKFHIANLRTCGAGSLQAVYSDIQDIQISPLNRQFGIFSMGLAVLQLYFTPIPLPANGQRTIWNWTLIAPVALTTVIFIV